MSTNSSAPVSIPVNNMRRTGLGMAAATANYYFKQKHRIEPHTTLNEHYGISEDRHYQQGEAYGLGFFTIGLKGYASGTDADGFPKPIGYVHEPHKNNLFVPCPLVMRKKKDDLSVAERANYRLRQEINRKGEIWVLYHARVMDMSNSVVNMFKRTVTVDENGVEDEKMRPHVYKAEDLRPTPKLPPADATTPANNTSLVAQSFVYPLLTAFDIAEIKRAMIELYGRVLEISELGFVHAAEVELSGSTSEGTPFNYTEIIDAQIGIAATTRIIIEQTVDDIPNKYELGASEPLYFSEDDI